MTHSAIYDKLVVYAFDKPYQCMQSVLKPRLVARHQLRVELELELEHNSSYSLSLSTMNVGNQLYGPSLLPNEDKTIAENV